MDKRAFCQPFIDDSSLNEFKFIFSIILYGKILSFVYINESIYFYSCPECITVIVNGKIKFEYYISQI